MIKLKTKKILKTFSLVLLGLATIGGVTTLTTHLIKNDKVTIHPTFEVGGLNAQGKYEEDKSTLYTKEKFACEGLQATLDFDSTINYQIFYYDILDNFVSSTDVITKGYSVSAPTNGAYARIEIIPTNDEDGKISFKEKYNYSKQLNLKVNKDAKKNIDEKFKVFDGKCFEVVTSPSSLIFSLGYIIENNGDYSMGVVDSGINTIVTCSNLLKVNGYKSISFDFTKVNGYSNETEKNYIFNIYSFDNDKIIENIVIPGNNLNSVTCNFSEFRINPDNIFISIYFNSSNIDISNSKTLNSIPGSLTLNK